MADTDIHSRAYGAGITLICPSGLQFATEGFARQGPGEVQALLPASAGAQVAVQRPAEYPDHFQGCIGEEEPAMARDVSDSEG